MGNTGVKEGKIQREMARGREMGILRQLGETRRVAAGTGE